MNFRNGEQIENEQMEKEIMMMEEIIVRHNANMLKVEVVMKLLQAIGLGRNTETANVLRAIAELIESPIEPFDCAKG